jgi:uncharacterized membrane protein YheB (UPF0754 family)
MERPLGYLPSMIEWILPPATGALIGWGTNWLALKMLFHPRQPVGVGPLKFQGVIPRRKMDIAARLGDMVENELVSSGVIHRAFEDPAVLAGFDAAAREQARAFAQERLPGIHSLVELLLPMAIRNKVEQILSVELEAAVPGLAHSLGEGLETSLPIGKLVRERVEGFSLDDLEALVDGALDRRAWTSRWGGALLGALVGFVQAVLFALMR